MSRPDRRSRGACNCGCVMFVVALVMIWGGGQGLWTALTNREPTVMTVAQYQQEHPRATWLKLTGGKMELLEASYMQLKTGGITEVFLPLRPADAEEGDKIHVLVCTKDQRIRDVIEKTVAMKDEKQILQFMVENADLMVQSRDVQGLVRYGIDLKEEDRSKLGALDANLDPGFIILDEGKEPELGFSLFMFGGGVALLLLNLALMAFRKKPAEAEAPPAEPAG